MSQTLYIIGNGFDIAHNIKSRYADFKTFVLSNGNRQLVDLMDVFFSNNRELWGDVEKALGEYDENRILDFCKPDDKFDMEHSLRDSAIIEDSPDSIFKPTVDEFIETFNEWVDSIDISFATPLWNLSKQDLYITFNYVDTLETIYHIPQSQILHIHGSRLAKDDEYVLGHNHYRNPLDAFNDDGDMIFEQNAYAKIIRWMNDHIKDTTSIINHNQDFFSSLSKIDKIVTMGHSFYEVDWPYMEEISNSTGLSIPWQMHYYSNDDLKRMQDFVAKVGLLNICYLR